MIFTQGQRVKDARLHIVIGVVAGVLYPYPNVYTVLISDEYFNATSRGWIWHKETQTDQSQSINEMCDRKRVWNFVDYELLPAVTKLGNEI